MPKGGFNNYAAPPLLLEVVGRLSDLVMLRPAYLSQKLDQPLPTKDGGTLRTVLDARTYMLALPKRRETKTQWQRAAELLLAEADVVELSKQIELALFYDAKLDVAATK